MCVGLRIKKYLADNGISMTHISRKTGIPLAKLSLTLSGKRKMSLEEYNSICGAISVEVDKFLEKKGV